MVLDKIVDAITGKDDGKKVKGRVVLMKKNVLDFTDVTASVLDGVLEFLGQRVSFELISTSLHDGQYYFFVIFLMLAFLYYCSRSRCFVVS